MNQVKVLWERRKVYSSKARDGPSHGGETAKGPGERGKELKAWRYNYNQEKNQGSYPKSQGVLLKLEKQVKLEIVSILPYFQDELMLQEDSIELEKMMTWSKKKQTKKDVDQSTYNFISRLTQKTRRPVVD